MLRINADDFGYSEDANEAIVFCFENKIINSTTIMVNAPRFAEATELAKTFHFDSKVGLHLNLTEFEPLTDNIRSNKKFTSNNELFNNPKNRGVYSFFNFSKKDKEDIKKEIEAQMVLFRRYFPHSIFLDSHHHIHTIYPVLKIVIELAKKYDFKIIRISMNVPKSRFPKNIYKKHINKLIKKYFPDSSALLTDTSDGHLDLIDSFDSLEIMVHPLKQNNLCFDRLTGYNLDKLKRLEDK